MARLLTRLLLLACALSPACWVTGAEVDAKVQDYADGEDTPTGDTGQ